MKKLIFIFLISFSSVLSYPQSVTNSVGINEDGSTPDPSAMLDIKSTTKGLLIPRMTSAERTGILAPREGLLVYDNETASFWFYKAAGWTELITGGGAGTNYWDTDGNHIYKNNTGNVGIGTTAPSTLLTLQTPINTLGFTHIGGRDSIIVTEGIGGVSASIGTSTFHAFRLNAGGEGRISIYPAGEVVVGPNATGPVGKLTVQTTNNADGISHLGENGNILKTRMGGTSAGIGTFSNTNMRIFANSFSAITIAAGTGNVGIGTDNTTHRLTVNGAIRAKEIRINTGWADFVFNKNYKLMPLSEVEQFIKSNKRLPGIPSAARLKKEGVDISDMQTKMMAKIEELTLYLIEANKTLEKLKQRVEAVEKTNQ